jgi:hypothetical protein
MKSRISRLDRKKAKEKSSNVIENEDSVPSSIYFYLLVICMYCIISLAATGHKKAIISFFQSNIIIPLKQKHLKIVNINMSLTSVSITDKDNITTELSSISKVDNSPSVLSSTTASRSRFAYVTLMHGIDRSFQYRGFLYNVLIMKKMLRKFGSNADFIAMIGYSNAEDDISIFASDLQLLKSHDIIVYLLPRLINKSGRVSFAGIYDVSFHTYI